MFLWRFPLSYLYFKNLLLYNLHQIYSWNSWIYLDLLGIVGSIIVIDVALTLPLTCQRFSNLSFSTYLVEDATVGLQTSGNLPLPGKYEMAT